MPICSRCKSEQPRMFYMPKRQTSGPHIVQYAAHLRKYRQIANQEKRQHAQGKQTDESDIKVGGSKQARKEAHVRTGLFKECRKHTRLEQQRHYGNQQHTDGIDETLRHHRTQRFGERNPVVLRQDTAAGNLPTRGTTRLAAYDTKTAYTLFDTLGYSPNGANVRFQRQPRNRCPSTPNTSEKAIQP